MQKNNLQKKISIIIPVYKSEKYLKKLIDSILNQTYSNLEIILVDDGSPDNSGHICDSYAKKDERIITIHKENGGTCDARNAGLKIATGEYLMFADGDDWLEKDCVQYLYSLIEDNNADMSMTDSIFTTRDRKQNEKDEIRIWNNKEAVAGIINIFMIPVGPWNKLYSMKIIKENNISFSVPWFGEGLYFSTMAAQYSPKVVVGHRKVYNYRLNNPNSGCTKKEVGNAINALNNIIYIKNSLNIESEDIHTALDWHIWSNNYNLLYYIIGAKEEIRYKNEYIKAKKTLRKLLGRVLKNRFLTIKEKIKIIIITIFPRFTAKVIVKKTAKALKKDLKQKEL